MSGEVIKEFLVGLGFKVDEAGLAKFTSGVTSATVAVTAMGAAAAAAATAIFAGVKGVANEYNELAKLAEQFRTTADAVDEFVDAAQILGVDNDKAVESLRNLDRAIVDTSMDMGRAKAVFEDLGISVKDAAGNLKPTTEVMAELAEKFKGMERGKQIRVMERLGLDPALLKVFNADLGALSAELAEIDKSVGFDFEQAVAEGKAFTAVWKTLQQEVAKWKMLFGKMYESIAVKMMPKFRGTMENITASMIKFRKIVMDAMPNIIATIMPIINVIMRIAEAFFTIAGRIASAALSIIGWLLKINDATDGWAGYILAAAAAWKYLNLAFLKTPLGQLIALAAIVALLIDDFLTFKEGGDSLIDWGSGFGMVMQGLTAILAGFLAYMALAKAATIAMTVATTAWSAATAFANGVLAAARVAVLLFNLVLYANPIMLVVAAVAALIAAGVLLIQNWDTVKEWFAGFFDWMLAGFNKLAEWGGKIKSFFTGGSSAPQGSLTPSPQAQAAMNGSNQNVNQQTQIVVQGAGDPNSTAKAVAGQQGRVNADMARNMKGAAR